MNRDLQKLEISNKIEKINSELSNQVSEYKDLGKSIAVIGGIIVSAYSIFRFFDKENTNQESNESDNSLVFSTIKGVAVSIALALVKEKLIDFLNNYDDQDDK